VNISRTKGEFHASMGVGQPVLPRRGRDRRMPPGPRIRRRRHRSPCVGGHSVSSLRRSDAGFAPGIPHWKGAPNETVKTLYTVKKDAFESTSIATLANVGTARRSAGRIYTTGCTGRPNRTRRVWLMPWWSSTYTRRWLRNPDYVLSVDDFHSWNAPRADTARRIRRQRTGLGRKRGRTIKRWP